MSDLEEGLKRIVSARDILRARGDATRLLITQLEEQLHASGACVSATLPATLIEETHWALGYSRHTSGWRIMACAVNGHAMQLCNTPLYARLILVEQLPALVKHIAEKMEKLAL